MAELDLTLDALRDLLAYDPETGEFRWRQHRRGSQRCAGDVAGNIDSANGYVRIRLFKVSYKAHRLAWLYVTGRWPSDQIDHRNGIRSDNRWRNLREATLQENNQNVVIARSDSLTGARGVSFVPTRRSPWRAYITLDRKMRTIGYFPTREQAAAAHLEAKATVHPFADLHGRLKAS